MGKFDSPITEVLFQLSLDGTAETVGDVSTWGAVHFGLGRVTRDELAAHHGVSLKGAGITAEDFPDDKFWIVHEDGQGFVDVSVFDDESTYRATLDHLERRWIEFDTAS